MSIVPTDLGSTSPTPHKIHLRGLDDLTSTDIESFVNQYHNTQSFDRIEWIDDTSANIVYPTPADALTALKAFVATDDFSVNHSTLEMLPAKSFPGFPNTLLKVRLAVLGDRKQPGARERSRFYLFNPEHDRQDRQPRDNRGRGNERRYRDRQDDYRSRPYKGRERRRRHNEDIDFDASLYDDDEASLAVRRSRDHSRIGSESESGTASSDYRSQRHRKVRFTGVGKELFPDRGGLRNSGRLRDRSASPMRDIDGDEKMDRSLPSGLPSRRGDSGGSANRLKAQTIKGRLKESAAEPLELFPEKAGLNHKRSDAFDATDSTADLFADKLRMPGMDGTNDAQSTKRDLMSRITKYGHPTPSEEHEDIANTQHSFKIRGTARPAIKDGFSIKGLATPGQGPKELFPAKSSLNSGKELFADRLDGRGGRRQRAEDMFY